MFGKRITSSILLIPFTPFYVEWEILKKRNDHDTPQNLFHHKLLKDDHLGLSSLLLRAGRFRITFHYEKGTIALPRLTVESHAISTLRKSNG